MINKGLLIELVEKRLEDTKYFLVSVDVSSDNSIVVEIDSTQTVDLDFCTQLTRHIEDNFDRQTEDYSLEVGSYSITKPFIDQRQYVKNIGREVVVFTADNKKQKGTLVASNEEYFVVEIETKEKAEGEKRKRIVKKQISFKYNDIKQIKLDF